MIKRDRPNKPLMIALNQISFQLDARRCLGRATHIYYNSSEQSDRERQTNKYLFAYPKNSLYAGFLFSSQ